MSTVLTLERYGNIYNAVWGHPARGLAEPGGVPAPALQVSAASYIHDGGGGLHRVIRQVSLLRFLSGKDQNLFKLDLGAPFTNSDSNSYYYHCQPTHLLGVT